MLDLRKVVALLLGHLAHDVGHVLLGGHDDRFLSPSLFHWKSQSGTPEGSATGLRYQTLGLGGNRAILFVRETQDQPYLFLGELKYLRHEGSRPMGIDFELKMPMPAKDFQAWASIVAA
ncbi:DUF3427 domain-containing protein [Geothrix sp. 21YS21S-2]|uniref:DUF3427 domain-containing protein n=1 Tax=Geothrix sp. 21YS21S-2 TaxID=3068893 RepID=UPI00358EF1CF